jgi:phage terminase large subunit-like protein
LAEERFLREGFTLQPDGRLPYAELIFSAPKKSGKTALGAMALLYVTLVLGGRFAEGYAVANDLEQAASRVFRAAARIVEASPLLRAAARITATRIEFPSTGATITALASDYAGAAGANPSVVVFDELWGYTSERAQRLWDEMAPVPTRAVSVRLTVTHAGFEGESELLWRLYKRGLAGEEIGPSLYRTGDGLLMFWSHDFVAPWQTEAWRERMRTTLRPNAYLRMIENRWVSTESAFVDLGWWDACVDPTWRPVIADKTVPVWVGVDVGIRRDCTAIVGVTWDDAAKKVRVLWHRIFQPSPEEPLDFEGTIEASLLALRDRFALRGVYFDPYQMQRSAQALQRAGVPMIEFPQSVPNLTEASTNLYELIKGQNLIAYPDEEVRLAVSRAVAVETSRGWRIAKEKTAHKIDVVVALAMAALGAVRGAYPPEPGEVVVSVIGAERQEITTSRAWLTDI